MDISLIVKEKFCLNCFSSRYYRIPGCSWGCRPDQALPGIGPHQTRPGSYKDLSPPFLEVKSVNFVFTNYILVHLQASGISGDFVSFFVSYKADQHWRWIQWLGPALCHTAFFKVKCINLVFTNYLLVYLQVPVFCGDFKSSFVSYRKPYRLITRQEVYYELPLNMTTKFQPD